jgi:hypothetical protein
MCSIFFRYLVKVATIIVANVFGLIIAVFIPIPGAGIVSYGILILVLAIIEIPLFGLDSFPFVF